MDGRKCLLLVYPILNETLRRDVSVVTGEAGIEWNPPVPLVVRKKGIIRVSSIIHDDLEGRKIHEAFMRHHPSQRLERVWDMDFFAMQRDGETQENVGTSL